MAVGPTRECFMHSQLRLSDTRGSGTHHITSHHITSHHITSHHITSHHITSHHITSHHITSHHITSHQQTPPSQISCRLGESPEDSLGKWLQISHTLISISQIEQFPVIFHNNNVYLMNLPRHLMTTQVLYHIPPTYLQLVVCLLLVMSP